MKKITWFASALFLLSSVSAWAQREERITLTTYYPAPFGIYQELAARRMKVGETYMLVDTEVADGTLIVEKRIGIGTDHPNAALDVNGTLLVTDHVGIGTAAPAVPLHVKGSAIINGRCEMSSLKVRGPVVIEGVLGLGSLQLGGDSKRTACDETHAGILRYDGGTRSLWYCNGRDWMVIQACPVKETKKKKKSSPYTLNPKGSPWDK